VADNLIEVDIQFAEDSLLVAGNLLGDSLAVAMGLDIEGLLWNKVAGARCWDKQDCMS